MSMFRPAHSRRSQEHLQQIKRKSNQTGGIPVTISSSTRWEGSDDANQQNNLKNFLQNTHQDQCKHFHVTQNKLASARGWAQRGYMTPHIVHIVVSWLSSNISMYLMGCCGCKKRPRPRWTAGTDLEKDVGSGQSRATPGCQFAPSIPAVSQGMQVHPCYCTRKPTIHMHG